MEKNIKNEKLGMWSELNSIIDSLQHKYDREKATDVMSQLLYSYDIKLRLLDSIDM